MRDYIGSNHKGIINSNEDLANALVDAVKANDLPGMADIDSSLYLFCKEIRKDKTVALSGECAILMILISNTYTLTYRY